MLDAELQLVRFDGHLFGADQPCFGCGPNHPIGMHLAFEQEGEELVSHFTPGEHYQGPPGILHGGLVATFADELAAWTVIAGTGKFGFTVTFEAKYRKAVRVGEPVVGRGRLTGPVRRLAEVEVTLHQRDTLVFTGQFRFALLDRAATERLLEGPIPVAWERFLR